MTSLAVVSTLIGVTACPNRGKHCTSTPACLSRKRSEGETVKFMHNTILLGESAVAAFAASDAIASPALVLFEVTEA